MQVISVLHVDSVRILVVTKGGKLSSADNRVSFRRERIDLHLSISATHHRMKGNRPVVETRYGSGPLGHNVVSLYCSRGGSRCGSRAPREVLMMFFCCFFDIGLTFGIGQN